MPPRSEKRKAKNKKRREKVTAKIRLELQKPFQAFRQRMEDAERKIVKDKLKHARKMHPDAQGFESNKKRREELKYAEAVLKDKTSQISRVKPKPTTKKKIKIDLAKKTLGKVAKVVGKASSPLLVAAEVALSSSPTQGEKHDKAVKERNEAETKKTGNKSKSKIFGRPTRKPLNKNKNKASGGTVKNYANGGSVRKAKYKA